MAYEINRWNFCVKNTKINTLSVYTIIILSFIKKYFLDLFNLSNNGDLIKINSIKKNIEINTNIESRGYILIVSLIESK